MVFDFVTLNEIGGSVWSYSHTGPTMFQMIYGEPLTQEQLDKLK